jgi:hypothetical protein
MTELTKPNRRDFFKIIGLTAAATSTVSRINIRTHRKDKHNTA